MLESGMTEVKLRNDQWRKIRSFLDERPRVYVGQERQCRRFTEAVLWMTRSGAQWRLLPKRYGKWNSVYKRFERWSEQGVWREMFEHFADDPDMERLLLDSSVIRAHACAAGARHEKGGKRHKHSVTVEAALAQRYM
jgi:transposase